MEYLYPVAGLSEKQWDEVMKPLIKPLLNALKTNGNFPRKLFFGPEKYQGLGFHHPYHSQMITQFVTLVEECNQATLTGKMLEASLEQFVLEIGTSSGMNTEDKRHVCHTTKGMMQDLWLFGTTHEIYLHQPFDILPWRDNDPYLMETFINHEFTAKELWTLNETRLFLQVTTLADICDIQGEEIMSKFFDCKEKCQLRNCAWPRTTQPTKKEQKLWQRALIKCFLEYSPEGNRPKRIKSPLGKWLRKPKWPEWYDGVADRLYVKSGESWEIWTKVPRRNRQRTFRRSDQTVRNTSGCPVSSYSVGINRTILRYGSFPSNREQTTSGRRHVQDLHLTCRM